MLFPKLKRRNNNTITDNLINGFDIQIQIQKLYLVSNICNI